MRFDHGLSRLQIGAWPSPLVRLDYASLVLERDVWVKREDAAGVWGGNKVRKLEYLLAEARERNARTLVAYGAGTSSWVAAVAYHGTARRFAVVAGVAGDVPIEYETLYARLGVRLERARALAMLPVAAARARAVAGPEAYVLPAGGTGLLGDVGSARAGVEIADAVESGLMPRPLAVYVASGTGGTAAGVAFGIGAEGLHVPTVAVRVTPRPLGTEAWIRRRLRALAARAPEVVPGPVVAESGFFGGGYGRPTAEAKEAMEFAATDGLRLDATYGAKAFAALLAHARAGSTGPLLFMHTSPGPVPRS